MSFIQFVLQLFFVSMAIVAFIFLFGLFSIDWAQNNLLGYYAVVGFIILFLPTFYIAKKSAQSANKQLFTGIIMLSVLSKLVVSIVMVFWYHKNFHPSGPLFLVPFFLVYIIYTIFESQFMIKLGKDDSKRKSVSGSSK